MKIFLLSLLISLTSCNKQADKLPPQAADGIYAEFVTSKGSIICALEYEKTPITVANFVALAEGKNNMVNEEYKGKKFYDSLKFHRVIPDFMIQGGDPLGNGSGGPGYKFKDEFHPELKHDKPGILSMANSGPKTNGSQFFITHKETPWLDNKHSVFGHVIEGQNIVDSIQQNDIIKTINIIRKGRAAKKFKAEKVFEAYFADEKKEQAEKEARLKVVKEANIKLFKESKEKATTLASGAQIFFINKSENKKPAIGDQVLVNYAGYLEDATLFDSNVQEIAEKYEMMDERRAAQNGYRPFPMKFSPEAQLIQGFRDGLLEMSVGDKALIFIPSHLGYGERAAGPIPPNSNLVFQLELVTPPTETRQ